MSRLYTARARLVPVPGTKHTNQHADQATKQVPTNHPFDLVRQPFDLRELCRPATPASAFTHVYDGTSLLPLTDATHIHHASHPTLC